MALTISDYLVTNDLTILLGFIAATVFLLQNLYKPQPLAHPILLGRQSDVARVRNPGESAVYRNYGTGLMGRLPIKPSKDVDILTDLVKSDSDKSRTLWSTRITNAQLKERVASLGTGLLRVAGLQPHESNVLLLLNDSIEFLISDLALSSHSVPSFTLTSVSLLSSVLELHPPSAIITDALFLPHLLELIYDSSETGHHIVIVVGEPDPQVVSKVSGQVKILKWADLEKAGSQADKIATQPIKSSDVFTVSFSKTESGAVQGVQFTHENITAGVAATRSLFPMSNLISPQDTIYSAHSLSTVFGRAIAYTAVFEGTSFATADCTKILDASILPATTTSTSTGTGHDPADVLSLSAIRYPIPSPTIAFIKPEHFEALQSSISAVARASGLVHHLAWRHKFSAIAEGFITNESLWDRLVFDRARAKIIGDTAATLRILIVTGGPVDASIVTPARIAFSFPIVNAYTHPVSAAPIFASHPLDLQNFPVVSKPETDPFINIAHVGPPSINVEAKLVGVADEAVENGADPVGMLFVRGPPVGQRLGDGEVATEGGWVATRSRGKVQTNGSFKVLTSM